MDGDLGALKHHLSQINQQQQSKARDWPQLDRHLLSTQGHTSLSAGVSVPSQASYFNAAALSAEKE